MKRALLIRAHGIIRSIEPVPFYLRNPGLMLFLLRNRALPTQQLFRLSWAWISMHGVHLFAKKVHHDIPAEKLRHFEYRYYFKWLFPDFSPKIVPLDTGQIALLKSKPTVVVIEHSKCELALCASLDAHGLHSAVIMNGRFAKSEIGNYGFATVPGVIINGSNAFVEAHSVLRAGAIVIAYIDYLEGERPKVSTSIFKFQQRVKAQLLFARVDLGPEGQMQSVFISASANDHAQSTEETIEEFRLFVRPSPNPPGAASR